MVVRPDLQLTAVGGIARRRVSVGKTVTAMSVIGMPPGTGSILGGRVIFDGRDVTALSRRELRAMRGREIGVVSQEPMISLNPFFTVGSQIAEAIRQHRGLSRVEARTRALELLEKVRLPNAPSVGSSYPHQLSGGMAQRVAIARALAGEPRLLIADEPTTALDVTIQAEILDLLRELQRDRRMAILFVTHDWGVVADICDRAVVMYAGEVVERATLDEMFRCPQHPYTEALLLSDPHNAPEGRELPTIPGTVPDPTQWPRGCHFHPRCRYATSECCEHEIALEALPGGRQTRCIHHQRMTEAP
jgi:peptide/nickel transport system permease protein